MIPRSAELISNAGRSRSPLHSALKAARCAATLLCSDSPSSARAFPGTHRTLPRAAPARRARPCSTSRPKAEQVFPTSGKSSYFGFEFLNFLVEHLLHLALGDVDHRHLHLDFGGHLDGRQPLESH